MGVKQTKINVNEIEIGMFVSGLDRPWTQTPFPIQGFLVREEEEIHQLKAHCNHVYIDVIKGSKPGQANLKQYTGPRGSDLASKHLRTKVDSKSSSNNALKGVAPLKVRKDTYEVTEPIRKEAERARELHQQVYSAVDQVMKQVDTGHQDISIQETKRAASAMVGSVIRNPDAFTWLTRVKEVDEHTYSHSVRSAVWGILLGRHIGISKNDLDTLTTGILLKDIGKTKLDKALLSSTERSAVEQRDYEKFVNFGVEILRQLPGVQPRVVTVVKTHRERINGGGYPEGLKGDKIPLLGKIAGIVTFYDEATNPRGKQPLSPSRTVSKLYEVRDEYFQSDLVVEFIRAIGLYPTGTIVELNTGEVAVVVEQNFERRLKPKVMVVLDATKAQLDEEVFLDLAIHDRECQEKIDAGKATPMEVERIEIARDLEPGIYDIDVVAIRDEYFERGTKKGRGLFSFFKKKR